MANPQIENGFTPIANELLEQICCKIKGSELSVLLVIIRFIYGFHDRKDAELSYSFIAKAANISRRHVCTCLKSLSDKNIILISEKKGKHAANVFRFNKDYDAWRIGTSEPEPPDEPQFPSEPEFPGEPQFPGSSEPQFPGSSEPQFLQEKQERKQERKQTQSACICFAQLWEEYPNKKGRARVTAKSLEAINRIGYAEMHRALERYKRSKPDWQHWQNGSTFFNGGYADYLDAAWTAETEERENGKIQDPDDRKWCCDNIL